MSEWYGMTFASILVFVLSMLPVGVLEMSTALLFAIWVVFSAWGWVEKLKDGRFRCCVLESAACMLTPVPSSMSICSAHELFWASIRVA